VKKINFYLLEYALDSLTRQKRRNIFLFSVLSFIIFLLSSVFFVRNSLLYQFDDAIGVMPDIVVQQLEGGRVVSVEEDLADELLAIAGVQDVVGRVWGYYHFFQANTDFAIVGVDEFEQNSNPNFVKDASKLQDDTMFIGNGVKKVLQKFYYEKEFHFLLPDATNMRLKIAGQLSKDSALWSDDVMLLTKESAKKVLAIDDNKVVDFALFVANKKEIPTIVAKIRTLFPTAKITTKENLFVEYDKLLSYRGGFFLLLFVVTLFTFFMIVYDKVSGVTSQEKSEVGILKAIGWRVNDILQYKFYEAFILSFFAYALGVIGAMFYVYSFDASIIFDIFVGSSQIKPQIALPFVFDAQTFFLIFFMSVPIYIAATIIPTWRVATLDVDELLR